MHAQVHNNFDFEDMNKSWPKKATISINYEKHNELTIIVYPNVCKKQRRECSLLSKDMRRLRGGQSNCLQFNNE